MVGSFWDHRSAICGPMESQSLSTSNGIGGFSVSFDRIPEYLPTCRVIERNVQKDRT